MLGVGAVAAAPAVLGDAQKVFKVGLVGCGGRGTGAIQNIMDAAALLSKCVEKGVAYVPGTHFYPFGGHENTFRLNFSMSTLDQIQRGMGLLNEVFTANL